MRQRGNAGLRQNLEFSQICDFFRHIRVANQCAAYVEPALPGDGRNIIKNAERSHFEFLREFIFWVYPAKEIRFLRLPR